MKNYNTNITFGQHKAVITIQQFEYVGHIVFFANGNCKGKDIIDEADFTMLDMDCIVSNDCDLQFDEDMESFTFTLKDSNGNTCYYENIYGEEMNDMVVAVEIIDYVETN